MKKGEEMKSIVKIERIRRITGYLTGDISRWGSSKQAELKDRVKHTQKAY
jgi:ribonucleoside-triphosphate reductase